MNVCGIDVSKKTLDVVTIVNDKVSKAMQFKNNASGHKALTKHLLKKISHSCLSRSNWPLSFGCSFST